MDFVSDLLFGDNVAHIIFIIAITVAVGTCLDRIRIRGISFGVTWILFVGIFISYMGMSIQPQVLDFIKQFGLILFIFTIGMQVGPGFFVSLKSGGLSKNIIAVIVVFLGVSITYLIHRICGVPLTAMIGMMAGAVISTASLGSAEQTYYECFATDDPGFAQGYAVAYPFGVISTVLCLVIIKKILNVQESTEKVLYKTHDSLSKNEVSHYSLEIRNNALEGKSIGDIKNSLPKNLLLTKKYDSKTGHVSIPHSDTVLHVGDRISVIVPSSEKTDFIGFFGSIVNMTKTDWAGDKKDRLISKTVYVTRKSIQGKRICDLNLRSNYDVNITTIYRADVDLLVDPQLRLQLGDRLKIVGSHNDVLEVAKFFGNSNDKLLAPNIVHIFIGIVLGVILGSIPFTLPGLPQTFKIGLAGGPLIVAILLSRFAPKFGVVTYTTKSANLMLRQIGLSLFMASVGLSAGETFFIAMANDGYIWILYAVIISVVPFLLMAFVLRKFMKVDFYSISGILAGSYTSPVALAYANQIAGNDIPSVNYATVYPLVTFLRIMVAQIMVLTLI